MIINKVSELLQQENLTPYTVARDLNLPVTTIYKLAKEPTRLPRKDVLEFLILYFDVEVEDILQII